jgi:hypothetical protein
MLGGVGAKATHYIIKINIGVVAKVAGESACPTK